MRRKKIWVVTLMAFMVLALPASAQKGKKPKKGKIPVTVTFRDLGGVVPVDEPDRIMSDCKQGDVPPPDACPYRGTIGSATGSFRMGIGAPPKVRRPQLIRELFLDFRDCVSPGQCTLPEPFLLTGSSLLGTQGAVNFHTSGIDLRDMFLNVPRDDFELLVGFDLESIGEGFWRLDFRPNDIKDCEGSSSSISVTRTTDVTWVIEAGPTKIACLLQPGEKVNILKFSGRYFMPFKITLVCEDPTQCDAPDEP